MAGAFYSVNCLGFRCTLGVQDNSRLSDYIPVDYCFWSKRQEGRGLKRQIVKFIDTKPLMKSLSDRVLLSVCPPLHPSLPLLSLSLSLSISKKIPTTADLLLYSSALWLPRKKKSRTPIRLPRPTEIILTSPKTCPIQSPRWRHPPALALPLAPANLRSP